MTRDRKRAVALELPLIVTCAWEPGAASPKSAIGPVPESSAVIWRDCRPSLTTLPEPLL